MGKVTAFLNEHFPVLSKGEESQETKEDKPGAVVPWGFKGLACWLVWLLPPLVSTTMVAPCMPEDLRTCADRRIASALRAARMLPSALPPALRHWRSIQVEFAEEMVLRGADGEGARDEKVDCD